MTEKLSETIKQIIELATNSPHLYRELVHKEWFPSEELDLLVRRYGRRYSIFQGPGSPYASVQVFLPPYNNNEVRYTIQFSKVSDLCTHYFKYEIRNPFAEPIKNFTVWKGSPYSHKEERFEKEIKAYFEKANLFWVQYEDLQVSTSIKRYDPEFGKEVEACVTLDDLIFWDSFYLLE
ncbi:hypothetical protein [Xanthocytophaga agilis]|uniref:Uncharacterized protein n=1 Tax=Xanthocytophaga agilis TaxID=3048010 RepID=A0AAE3R5N5_9BACT|nr:hypothetical protein [Xanthocytophaga agilis]MDJ1504326.1 hypothetical protein [Xanthocytophaga agilis]